MARKLLYSTRLKLVLSFIGVTILVGTVSLIVGGQLLYKAVYNEAKTRIRLDLNTAREIYMSQARIIKTALSIATLDNKITIAVLKKEREAAINKLTVIAERASLDFAGIATSDCKTFCRIGPHAVPLPNENTPNPIVKKVCKECTPIIGTLILSEDFLLQENPLLARRARIPIYAPKSAQTNNQKYITSGSTIIAGIPLFSENKVIGVLYGGILLNRDTDIVDTVCQTVFQNEIYQNKSVGIATIFLNDVRIETNVLDAKGNRAIGTRVSSVVKNRVLTLGKTWTDRALVVNSWYITAYEPLRDIFGKKIGILSVGVLEEKYTDVKKHVLSIFVLITLSSLVIAIIIGMILAHRIMKPVHQLIQASEEVSKGNLNPHIEHISKDELGTLQKTFLHMLNSLKKRDLKQKAESEFKLLQSEKQASIGRLAAGVAHEINNPLTGVLTFSHLLLRRNDLPKDVHSDLKTIVDATERVRKIVKGLLDFSRQTRLEAELTDINQLVKDTITLVENQALINGITLITEINEDLPKITVDRNQLQSVILNIIINAFDATKNGGKVTISTQFGISISKEETKGIEIAISDTGCGIPQKYLDKLFDPFFTTKEVGQGTGLGLAVSYGIIARHGGTIRVQSKVNEGSTFTIWLPLEKKNES